MTVKADATYRDDGPSHDNNNNNLTTFSCAINLAIITIQRHITAL